MPSPSSTALEVRPQPRLGPGQTFRLAVNAVRYRLFRSLVTVAVVTVAVAFLTVILAESLMRRSVGQSVRAQIQEVHLTEGWLGRLGRIPTPEELFDEWVAAPDPDRAAREAAHLAGLPEPEVRAAVATARATAPLVAFFRDLDYGRRQVLTGGATGIEAMDVLARPGALDRFAEASVGLATLNLPGGFEALAAAIPTWSDTSQTLGEVVRARTRAVARIGASLGRGPDLIRTLQDPDLAWVPTVREAGFEIDPDTAARLAARARRQTLIADIEATLAQDAVRRALAARLDRLPARIGRPQLWSVLRDERGAEWFVAMAEERSVPLPAIAPADLVRLAEDQRTEQRLLDAERRTAELDGGFLGIGARMTLLVGVSLLVCVVGISNAMLMSVAERFREIATLKCLGALDGFIMLLFVMEASLLGLAGGVLGVLAGVILAFLRMLAAFGGLLLPALPWADLGLGLGLALVAGVILAALAAVYPSFQAARLAPMEAMRIE